MEKRRLLGQVHKAVTACIDGGHEGALREAKGTPALLSCRHMSMHADTESSVRKVLSDTSLTVQDTREGVAYDAQEAGQW